MNWFKGIWHGIVNISKKVLGVFGPALASAVAQSAAEFFPQALALVTQAETNPQLSGGTAKRDWVLGQLKAQLPGMAVRTMDYAIVNAVAQISQAP